MSDVFELIHNDNSKVVIKVNIKSTLDIAMNPYIDGNMEYITVTKGKKHILTIIYKDGHTFDFHWGDGGYTLIGENLKELKSRVIDFIEVGCHIMLDLAEPIKKAVIFYNDNFKKWQLTINGNAYIWSKVNSFDEMVEWVKDYITVNSWNYKVAETGIDTWVAEL